MIIINNIILMENKTYLLENQFNKQLNDNEWMDIISLFVCIMEDLITQRDKTSDMLLIELLEITQFKKLLKQGYPKIHNVNILRNNNGMYVYKKLMMWLMANHLYFKDKYKIQEFMDRHNVDVCDTEQFKMYGCGRY